MRRRRVERAGLEGVRLEIGAHRFLSPQCNFYLERPGGWDVKPTTTWLTLSERVTGRCSGVSWLHKRVYPCALQAFTSRLYLGRAVGEPAFKGY